MLSITLSHFLQLVIAHAAFSIALNAWHLATASPLIQSFLVGFILAVLMCGAAFFIHKRWCTERDRRESQWAQAKVEQDEIKKRVRELENRVATNGSGRAKKNTS
jgi:membrane protein implicated in regulation of membrane protease activity